MSNRNITLIFLGSTLAIVALAFIGRWTMGAPGADTPAPIVVNEPSPTTPSVPYTGGNTTGTTSPTSPVFATSTMITQADANKTVTMKVGSQFLLNLGGPEEWKVAIGESSIVRRVPNASAAKGTQGLFESLRVGTTTLSAEGRPVCGAGMMCAQYIINFTTVINVVP